MIIELGIRVPTLGILRVMDLGRWSYLIRIFDG
jgi:hypothetical protein